MTRLGDVLEFAGAPERISRPQEEKFVTLRVKGGGAVERPRRDGHVPVPFTGYRVSPGQFIYSRIDARNGAYAIVPPDLEGAVVSKDFPVFRIRCDRVEPSYLMHFVKGSSLQQQVQTASFGATNRQRVSEETFLSFRIPLPALAEQRRIAAILDRADAVRAKRRQVLAHLDSLASSIFRDMFGDPITNDRRLARAAIGSLAVVQTGNSPSRVIAENFGGEIEWLKSDNLGGFVATHAHEGLSAFGMRRARIAPEGSVLVTCIAGSPASIGKASIVDRAVAFNQQINAVFPSDSIDGTFLLGQLKAAPELVRAKSTGGMKGLVNKSAFSAIEVLAPPINAQREYARRVHSAVGLRAANRRLLSAEDELFAALQSRAFRGEL